MNTFLAHLASCVLTVHVLLGCCAHHAHRCGETHDAVCQSHDADEHDHEHPASSPQQDDCKGPACYYVLPGKVQLRGLSGTVANDVVPQATIDGFASPELSVSATTGPSHPPPLPLRWHLLCRVLLI